MKKRILAIFMTLVILVSTACIALAAGGVELPMIPIGNTSTVNVKLSSDADRFVHSGGRVTYTTGISDIYNVKLSKAELTYTYSDGIVFEDDVKVIGLPEGWEISGLVNSNNVLSFTVADGSGSSPITGRDLDITFSFIVATVSGSQQSVNLSEVVLYDELGDTIRYSKKVSNNTFTTEASIPTVENIGASLRINNIPALRFGMTVAKDERFGIVFPDGFDASSKEMKFGLLLVEKNKLFGELTVNTASVTDVVFTEEFSSTNNEIVFVYTLNDVKDYSKEYAFRPYVMYRETPNGAYQYHYGETRTRSAKSVAEMELLSETSTKKIEMLKKFIEE